VATVSKRRRRLLMQESEASENFWPSFTDLTSTIALILFVLVLLAYVQNLISSKSLSQARTRLEQTLEQLQASQQKLQRTVASVELAQAQLHLSEQKIDQQSVVIAESSRELQTLRANLQSIAVLRLDVLRRVKESIEAELRPAKTAERPLVVIGDNGNIVLNESVLFESNSHAIKRDGRPLLDTLARGFANVLDDPLVRDSIDVILVQGHTDERGSVPYNRELSARRANAVLDYMFESNPRLEQSYGGYFASSAYSEFRPVQPGKTEADHQQNRRIEVSVVPKDTSMRTLIDEYMRNLDPALRGAPAP
jgi:chemotaxis protein MotB